jgi:ABC-2 type transport system permease protein
MLWYKAWLETRSRFLIALVGSTLLCARLVAVFLQKESPRQVGQILHAGHETLAAIWLLAITLLMMGGLLRENAAGTSAFTLSLPVSRMRLMLVRLATITSEAIALAVVPWIGMLLAGKVAGNRDFLQRAGLHLLLLLAGGILFLALAYLVSSSVPGEYTAPVVSCGGSILLAYALSGDKLRPYSPWVFMTGTGYFHWRTGLFVRPIPWLQLGLFLVVAVVVAIISIKLIDERDF